MLCIDTFSLICEHLEYSEILNFALTSKTNFMFFKKNRDYKILIKKIKYFFKKVVEKRYGNHYEVMIKEFANRDVILTGSFLLGMIHCHTFNDIDLYSKNDTDNYITTPLAARLSSNFDKKIKKGIRWSDLGNMPEKKLKLHDYCVNNGLNQIFYNFPLDEITLSYEVLDFRAPSVNDRHRQYDYYTKSVSEYIETIREYNLHNNYNLQMITTRCAPEKCVELFDFDFCKVYYSFKYDKIVFLDEKSVLTKTHVGFVDKDKTSYGRKEKYMKRGYVFVE